MFFFMYDLEYYRDELRGFYFDILKKIPRLISKITEELVNDIKGYNHRMYEKKYITSEINTINIMRVKYLKE